MLVYQRMFLALTAICGFVGIFYYTIVQSGYFKITRGTLPVNNILAVTGVVSFTQQGYNQYVDKRGRHNDVLSSPQKSPSTHYSLQSMEIDSTEDLERYTLSKPSEEKRWKLRNEIDEKFLRNDERYLARLMDGHLSSPESDGIFRKSGVLSQHSPNVIIIGVKKGGTRALLEILKLHPHICACGPEMHFFERYYDKGINWYRGHMPLCYENELTVEKTPSYFVTSGVEKDVYNYSTLLKNPLKLLVILRDPTTRAISDYTQSQYKRIRLSTFEDNALKTDSDTKNIVVNESWSAIKIGAYSKHLKRWLKYFSAKDIHLISGESLTKDPYTEIKLVEKFLNLTSFIKPQHFVYNNTKKFYCFDRNLSTSQSSDEATSEQIPLRCLGTTKGRAHVEISKNAEKMLRNYYKPFNEELYRITGRNFGWK